MKDKPDPRKEDLIRDVQGSLIIYDLLPRKPPRLSWWMNWRPRLNSLRLLKNLLLT